MPETSLVTILLGVISVCLIAITVTALLTAREFRMTLRRINVMLPRADRALQDAQRALSLMRQCVTRADLAAQRVEAVVHAACDAASEAVTRFNQWRDHAQQFLTHRFGNGNGAGSAPRPHHRRG